jgi:hypothetical protein
MLWSMKITLAEIDLIIERSKQWTRHREAMQIMGAALRAHGDGRRLGDILTAQQMELVSIGCSGPDDLPPALSNSEQAGRSTTGVMSTRCAGCLLKK